MKKDICILILLIALIFTNIFSAFYITKVITRTNALTCSTNLQLSDNKIINLGGLLTDKDVADYLDVPLKDFEQYMENKYQEYQEDVYTYTSQTRPNYFKINSIRYYKIDSIIEWINNLSDHNETLIIP